MIRTFKWWWAWEYENIENWLESMEATGLRLTGTRLKGILFYFEKCKPAKARYCIDFQSRLTPEYITLVSDDGWKLYQIGMGWYVLRKEYEDERPELYTDFEALVARNRWLLTLVIILFNIELFCMGNLVWDAYKYQDRVNTAVTGIFSSFIFAFFVFIITNLYLQIKKFSKKY